MNKIVPEYNGELPATAAEERAYNSGWLDCLDYVNKYILSQDENMIYTHIPWIEDLKKVLDAKA